MKKFHITYITTNSINGKQYIGDHSTNNLDDKYIGSGNLMRKAIKKYGKKNFKRKILEICESKQKAFDFQEKYINEFNTLVPNGYNLSPTGGLNVKRCFSEEAKRKIGAASKGRTVSAESRLKMSMSRSGENNPMYGKGYKIIGNKNGMFEIGHTEKTKEKMRKPKTKEHIKNLKKSIKNQKKYKCPHCDKLFAAGNLYKHIYGLKNRGVVSEFWVLEVLKNKLTDYI